MRAPGLKLLAGALVLAGASAAAAAVKPGLEGAQELFRRNRWQESRAHLRSQWASLPAKDQPAASFLIGRSYVREAEFYRAARRLGIEVGLLYYEELAGQRGSRAVPLVPLFASFYQLEAQDYRAAERGLVSAQSAAALPPEWKASARLRRAVALQRLGRPAGPEPTLPQAGAEARLWRLLLTGSPDTAVTAASRRERLLAAPVLFRAGRGAAAESLVGGVDLDLPDAEVRSDPRKVLRFHDPLLATAWERVCWERAIVALQPLAAGPNGVERTLAAYYLGLSLSRLGALEESARYLKQAAAGGLPAPLQPTARLLTSADSWKRRTPPAPELASLWEATQGQPETVLEWDELARPELLRSEPFASRLDSRLKGLLQTTAERPSGALVGGWALARLRRGDDPSALVASLSEHRDDANKNKIDWNDPLLLLALAAANQRDQQYAQALETLFELSKSFPGLRWLQWNLQGVYAARQKAGGETRISQ